MRSSRISRWFGGTRGVLLTLYTMFILFASAVLRVRDAQFLPKWLLLSALLSALLCPPLLRFAEKLRIGDPGDCRIDSRKWALIFFAVPLICFLFKFIVYYPGGFLSDSLDQYGQALTGQYNNWHPVIHTLLFFTLPLSLSGGWVGSIILFQILLFSLALSYAFSTLRRIAGTRFALVSLLLVLLNPETTNLAVFPFKDTAFGIGVLLLVSFTLRIFFSSGDWLRKPLNLIVFAVVLALTALIRHNGVLFVVPLLLALCFLVPWKRLAALAACAVFLFCGIRFPLYSALQVSAPASPAFETLGLPLSIICSCAVRAPESLDEETMTFATRLISPEGLASFTDIRDFNDVKYKQATDIPAIAEYGAGRILSMAARCFFCAPLAAFRSLFGVTDVVFTLTDDYNYCDYPRTRSLQYPELLMQGIPSLQNLCNRVSAVLNLVFPWLFMYVGAMHYVLIVLLLAKCRFKAREGRQKILMVLPVFVYNFGTVLLLSGVADSSRYFAYTFWVTPFLVALLLRGKFVPSATRESFPSSLPDAGQSGGFPLS